MPRLMRPPRLAILILANSWIGLTLKHQQRGIGLDDAPLCECSCCEVGGVPPSRQSNGMDVQCSPAVNAVSSCPEQCVQRPLGAPTTTQKPQVAHLHSLFGATNSFEDAGEQNDDEQRGELVVYGTYCFARCAPKLAQNIGAECEETEQVGLPPPPPPPQAPPALPAAPQERGQAPNSETAGSPALDVMPEMQIAAPNDAEVEAAEAADGEAMEEAAAKAAVAAAAAADQSPEEAAAQANARTKETGALIAQASGQVASAASFEARAAKAEAMANRALASSVDNLHTGESRVGVATGVAAQLKEAAIQASIYAKSAKASAERARQEYQQILDIPQIAASEATQMAIAELQRRRDYSLKMLAAVEDNTVPTQPPLTEEGQRYALPWRNAMQQAAGSRDAYRAKAQQLEMRVDQLQEKAHHISLLNATGRTKDANLAMARKLLRQSEAADVEAQRAYEMADKIDNTIPQYEAQATAAASRASTISRMRWMPPPVVSQAQPFAGPAPAAAPVAVASFAQAHVKATKSTGFLRSQ